MFEAFTAVGALIDPYPGYQAAIKSGTVVSAIRALLKGAFRFFISAGNCIQLLREELNPLFLGECKILLFSFARLHFLQKVW